MNRARRLPTLVLLAAPALPGAAPAQSGDAGAWVVPREQSIVTSEPAALLPEATYIVRQRGVVETTPDGHRMFRFVGDDAPEGIGPVELLPCARLMEMERVMESRRHDVVFELNAQAFVYEGKNYLMPLLFRIADDQATRDVRSPVLEQEQPEPADTQGTDDAEPDVDALIETLRPGEGRSRPLAPPPADAADEEGAPQSAPMREGALLVARTGRLISSGDGRWTFTIDNDTDTAPNVDAPLPLLPCSMLEQMVRRAEQSPVPVRFVVSGQATLYRRHNFLLPTMFRIEIDREGNLVTAQ